MPRGQINRRKTRVIEKRTIQAVQTYDEGRGKADGGTS